VRHSGRLPRLIVPSPERRAAAVLEVMEAIRALGDGRYACLLEPGRIVLETPEPEDAPTASLHRLLDAQRAALFAIPPALAAEAAFDDPFAEWDEDEFLLAFVNRRVCFVVACPDAEALKDRAQDPLRVLADRLLRLDERYRLDERGGGFFFGRARLDVVVVGGQEPG
jgi:hypothetical protein